MGEDAVDVEAWLVARKLPVVRTQLGWAGITRISAINNMRIGPAVR